MQYVQWIWPNQSNVQICNVVAGKAYHIGVVDESWSVEKVLTPMYSNLHELCAYLQGVFNERNKTI